MGQVLETKLSICADQEIVLQNNNDLEFNGVVGIQYEICRLDLSDLNISTYLSRPCDNFCSITTSTTKAKLFQFLHCDHLPSV